MEPSVVTGMDAGESHRGHDAALAHQAVSVVRRRKFIPAPGGSALISTICRRGMVSYRLHYAESTTRVTPQWTNRAGLSKPGGLDKYRIG